MLSGRAAVITGAAQGIGLALARSFAAHGARIVIGDVAEAAAREAAETLPTEAVGVRCDVTSGTDVSRLLEVATETFVPLDVMVNNAGITRDATIAR